MSRQTLSPTAPFTGHQFRVLQFRPDHRRRRSCICTVAVTVLIDVRPCHSWEEEMILCFNLTCLPLTDRPDNSVFTSPPSPRGIPRRNPSIHLSANNHGVATARPYCRLNAQLLHVAGWSVNWMAGNRKEKMGKYYFSLVIMHWVQ